MLDDNKIKSKDQAEKEKSKNKLSSDEEADDEHTSAASLLQKYYGED